MTREPERLARVALSLLGEPGHLGLARWVRELGPQPLLDALRDGTRARGLAVDAAERLPTVDAEATLERAARQGMRFVIPGDDEWPSSLDDLAHGPGLHDRGDVPLGLWVRGPMRLDELAGSVAVVGSRSATTYGADVAAGIGRALAEHGIAVVSGAAYGIDHAAHRGALIGRGRTVAVLACGADRVYPVAHRRLVDHLAETSAVISEVAPGGAPMRVRFLARNRIIAALTRATVVVEAAVRSGALNTASWAEGLNRLVLGVPGPVTSAQSQGVHQLVRIGGAQLVTSGADVLEAVGAPGEHLVDVPRAPVRPRDRLRPREQQVLDGVPAASPAGPASIARAAGLGVAEVEATLLRLVDRGLVERIDDGWVLGAEAHR